MPTLADSAHGCIVRDNAPAEAILRDGTSVSIRTVGPADRERLVALFDRMSPLSVRHRFFGGKKELTDADFRYLAGGDTGAAIAVTVSRRSEDIILGMGRFVTLPEPRVAEVAFEVGDADQGRGIGTLLLDHLARIARARGIDTFRADVEADNAQMLDVFGRSGFVVHESLRGGVFSVDFPLAVTEQFAVAASTRERIAASRHRGACESNMPGQQTTDLAD